MVAQPMQQDRIPAILQQHDFLSYLENDLGQGFRKGHRMAWQCPFHDDSTPSFMYNPESQKCRCFGCGWHGDIIDYVESRANVPKPQAIEMLARSTPLPPAPKRDLLHSREYAKPVYTLDDVGRWYREGGQFALPYFLRRGLSIDLIDKQRLGAWEAYPQRRKLQSGEWLTFPHLRYTIPYVWDSKVYMVNTRRDEQAAIAMYTGISDEVKMKVRGELILTLKREPTNQEILDWMVNAKYKTLTWGNVNNMPYGVDLFARKTETGVEYRRWNYALITEGEVCRDSLVSAGYPALKVKTDGYSPLIKRVPALLQNVPTIYIVADRDENEVGLKNALAVQALLGRGTVVLSHDKGFKDANDVAVAGELDKWLSPYGMVPILDQL